MPDVLNRNVDDYPLTGFRFEVEIDGIVEALFTACSGLSIETEVVEYQEGGENTHTHKLKGQTKYSNIVLKRGVTSSKDFFAWMDESVTKPPGRGRKNGIIRIFDDNGTTVKSSWEFKEAWPCKFEGPQFDTGSSAALIETLELAHHGLKRTQ
jgi:phage tail-like protein